VIIPVVAALIATPTSTPTSTPATTDDLAPPHDRLPFPTLLWLVPQLIPSPEIFAGTGGTRFGVRWQVTPILYSFGLHRRAFPWRFLVVDPLARQSGSVELFFSPEYVASHAASDLMIRTGVRSYFPLVEKGDYLSMSIGASHYLYDGHSGAAFEGGLYTLFGVFGVQLTYSPSHLPAEWIATLRFRYF
jgi:hypothetical protein